MSSTAGSGSYSTAIARTASRRLLERLGGDDRDGLAVVAHAVDREHGLVGELEPVGLRAGHVGVREHGVDAGQLQRRGDVDRDDARVRVRARSVAPCSIPGALRSLEYANSPVTLGRRRRAATISPIRPRTSCVVLMRAAPRRPRARRRGCGRSRCSGRGCPRAPRGCRRRSARARAQQRGGRDDEAGRAEAALHRAGRDERALHRVQLAVRREPLDRHDLAAVGLRAVHEARADELAVEQHRAGAALALLAGVLRAGQAESLAQHEEQALGAVDVGLAPLAVDRQLDPQRGTSRARGASSTPSAWRR